MFEALKKQWLFFRFRNRKAVDALFSRRERKELYLILSHHPLPEVRESAINQLAYDAKKDASYEKKCLVRLAELMRTDSNQSVLETSYRSTISILAESAYFQTNANAYSDIIYALISYLKTAVDAKRKRTIDLPSELEWRRVMPRVKFSEHADAWISLLSAVAENDGIGESIRNQATGMLWDMHDERTRLILAKLSTVAPPYVKANAKRALIDLDLSLGEGTHILRFPKGYERQCENHLALISALKKSGAYPDLKVLALRSIHDAASCARLVVITGSVEESRKLPKVFDAPEAKLFVQRECASDWSAVNPEATVTNVAADPYIKLAVIQPYVGVKDEILHGWYKVEQEL